MVVGIVLWVDYKSWPAEGTIDEGEFADPRERSGPVLWALDSSRAHRTLWRRRRRTAKVDVGASPTIPPKKRGWLMVW